MQHTLALESHSVALDLYALLRDLDPARWRDELEQAIRERVNLLVSKLYALAEHTSVPESLASLQDRLAELADMIRERIPGVDLPSAQLKARWMAFRQELQPAYEALAGALRAYAIHVPSLRPTNYVRNVFHVGSGLIALFLLEVVLPEAALVWVTAALAAAAWSMEAGRRWSPAVNRVLMVVFGKVAHPHESHRVNSSTWYTTALLLLTLTASVQSAAIAVTVLAFADPAAAIIGRRFGRTKLVNGRSLEGTATFMAMGTLAACAVTSAFHPELGVAGTLAVSITGAVFGGVAELFSRRVDDNLSIPLSVALGAGLAALVMGA